MNDDNVLMKDMLLTPGEVASIFRVDIGTVARWADNGWIAYIRTPGGHRRYKQSTVDTFLKKRTLS